MSVQNGIGAITDKGLAILAYINSQTVPPDLAFQYFYISDIAVDTPTQGLTLTDPSANLGGGAGTTTKAQLDTFLNSIGCSTEAKNFVGTVTRCDAGGSTSLPLLLTIPVGGIVNPLGNAVPIYSVFVTVESPIPADSSAEYVFWHGLVYYEDNSTTGTYTDDTNLPFYYYPGTNLLLRVNMEYSSGFPETISFTDSQVVEIEAHDELLTSHSTTHLSLGGLNSPTANIDWGAYKITNLADATADGDAVAHGQLTTITDYSQTFTTASALQSHLDSMPKIINHNVTLNFSADTSFETTTITVENFSGGGVLNIAGLSTPTMKNISFDDNSCQIWLKNFRIVPGSSAEPCIEAQHSYDIVLYGMYLKGGDHTTAVASNSGIIHAQYSSKIELLSNVVIEKDASYIPKVGLRASTNSQILCEGWSQADDDAITGIVFYAETGGIITKPPITPGTVSLTSLPRSSAADSEFYEYCINGGIVMGRYGVNTTMSGDFDTDTFTIGTTTIDYVTDVVKLIGPYIPYGRTVDIQFDNGSSPYTMTETIGVYNIQGKGTLKFSSSTGTTVIGRSLGDIFNIKACDSRIEIHDLELNMTNNNSGYGMQLLYLNDVYLEDVTLTYPTQNATGLLCQHINYIQLSNLELDGFDTGIHLYSDVHMNCSLSFGGSQEPAYLFDVSYSDLVVSAITAFKPTSAYFNNSLGSHIKVTDPDVTFSDSWSSAEMYRYINAIPKELTTDWDITINNPSTTYSLTSSLTFEGFYGSGAINVVGDTTTPANCDFDGAYSIVFNECSCEIKFSGIQLNTSAALYGLYIKDCNNRVEISDCEFSNSGSYNVQIDDSTNVYMDDVKFLDTPNTHIYTERSRVIISDVLAGSSTASSYGIYADYGSLISMTSTTNNLAGSSANAAWANGSKIFIQPLTYDGAATGEKSYSNLDEMTNITNPANLNCDTVTVAELADVVGALITRLVENGIIDVT